MESSWEQKISFLMIRMFITEQKQLSNYMKMCDNYMQCVESNVIIFLSNKIGFALPLR